MKYDVRTTHVIRFDDDERPIVSTSKGDVAAVRLTWYSPGSPNRVDLMGYRRLANGKLSEHTSNYYSVPIDSTVHELILAAMTGTPS